MKIALYAAHAGLQRMMEHLLCDHEVINYSNTVFEAKEPEVAKEEVIISTFPYRELAIIPKTKRVIVYATDPFPNPGIFVEGQASGQFITVGDSDGINVYQPMQYPIKPQFVIPHAINPDKYPKFKGTINAIAICQRKPYERWNEISGGGTGVLTYLEAFLPDIPYHVLHVPNDKDYFETLSQYRGVFYYSNNPYTLTMFECMAMQMPMVGFGYARGGDAIMRKYLHYVTTDSVDTRAQLLRFLIHPQPETYTPFPFVEAKQKWNEVIKYAYESK